MKNESRKPIPLTPEEQKRYEGYQNLLNFRAGISLESPLVILCREESKTKTTGLYDDFASLYEKVTGKKRIAVRLS